MTKKKVTRKVKHIPVSKKQLLIQWKARERKQLEEILIALREAKQMVDLEGKEGIKTKLG